MDLSIDLQFMSEPYTITPPSLPSSGVLQKCELSSLVLDALEESPRSEGSSIATQGRSGPSSSTSLSPSLRSTSASEAQASPRLISRASMMHVCKVVECGQRFAYNHQLERHARQHKRYTCHECSPSISYSHPKNLREHNQSKHRNIRYSCDVDGCNHSVSHKKNLARHKTAKHGL